MTSPSAAPPANLSRPTVLVVDDDRSIRDLAARILRPAGCTVLAAEGAEDGMAVCVREALDLVIVDQRLPGRSGYDFIRDLRGALGDAAPPCILYSGALPASELPDGVVAALRKPVPMEEFRAVVMRALRRVRPTRRLAPARRAR